METKKIDFTNLFWYYFLKCYVFIYQVSSITKKNPRTNPAAIFKECLLIFMWGKNKIA